MIELTEQEKEVFSYLDDLRESGVTNMFGCGPYVKKEYPQLKSNEVSSIVVKWMETFEELHPND